MERGSKLDSRPMSWELGALGLVEIGSEIKRMKDGQSTAQRCVDRIFFYCLCS